MASASVSLPRPLTPGPPRLLTTVPPDPTPSRPGKRLVGTLVPRIHAWAAALFPVPPTRVLCLTPMIAWSVAVEDRFA
jgi:hypothetical protein